MGVPSCTVILSDNQCQVAQTLYKQGVAVNLGWFYAINLRTVVQTIGDLIVDERRRCAMSSQGRLLVDGNGMQAIIAALREYR